MKLTIVTPTAVVVEADGVRHVRAEDASGAFGIQPGHQDLIAALTVSVLTWRDSGGADHHVAVRGGVLAVRGGAEVEVATREAFAADDLARLSGSLLDTLRRRAAAEAAERARSQQMRARAIRQICRYLRTGKDGGDALPLGPAREAARG